jgi:hypothetical protein
MMVHFRKRFPADFIDRINRLMFEPEALDAIVAKHHTGTGGSGDGPPPPSPPANSAPDNKGTLMLDATVAPSDIRYPSDLSLLNESRENLEQAIEELWEHSSRTGHKTAYSRKKARREYLAVAKQKRPRRAKARKAIGLQLRYVKSNIDRIGELLMQAGMEKLPEKRYARIMTICELHRQQHQMHRDRTRACDNRIVSLRQPHVRPMVRGKAGRPCEFGQKISTSVVEGYTFVETQQYDGFNEGVRLIGSVERYRERYGFYPEAVLADRLYRNRGNLSYCKERGIRLSGPRLGRPKKHPTEAERRMAARDGGERNTIEGRYGIAKRRFGLGLIMKYLPETGLTAAAMHILCMNMSLKLGKMGSFIFSFAKRLIFAVFCKNLLCHAGD